MLHLLNSSELKDPRQVAKIEYPFFDVVLTVCAAIGGRQGWGRY